MFKKIKFLVVSLLVIGGVVVGLSVIIFLLSSHYYGSHAAENILIVSSNVDQAQDLVLMQHFPQDEKAIIITI